MKQISLQLPLVVSSGILIAVGLLILWSISPQAFGQQFLFVVLGGVLFYIVSRVDYRLWLSLSGVWYALVNLLLILTLFVGSTTRGSTRWIDVGAFRFQPSEFVKPVLILLIAGVAGQLIKKGKSWQMLLLILLPVGLIYIQPDLGSSLIMLALSASMLWSAGLPAVYFLVFGLLLVIGGPLIWQVLKTYQQERILTFLDPSRDPLGSGYNAIQAMIAVGSGMFLGRGLGHGTQSQLRFLPERNTDFIFATIGEELGFVGGFGLLLVYGWLLFSILRVASECQDLKGKLICVGAFVVIAVQVFINIGMNLGLLPVTGITLPLISAGGSSMLSMLLVLGLVSNVASLQAHYKPTLEIK